MNSAQSFEWNEAAVRTMRELATKGESASQIGRTLGVTRNAVIGKCKRIGLTLGSGRTLKGAGSRNLEARLHARAEDGQAAPRPKAARAVAGTAKGILALTSARPDVARQRVEAFMATPTRQRAFNPLYAPAGARKVKLEQLERGDCRWPLYEDGPMVFCGCPVSTFDRNGQPDVYCDTHMAMRKPRPAP